MVKGDWVKPGATVIDVGINRVTTLDGTKSRVTVPEGTQPGKQFRLKGKGMPVLKSSQRGDLYVEAVVETPRNLTPRQKELLAEFAAEAGEQNNSPDSANFFDRLKSLFN